MEQTLVAIDAQPYALDSDSFPPDAGELAAWLSPTLPLLHGEDAGDPEDELDATIWAALLRP